MKRILLVVVGFAFGAAVTFGVMFARDAQEHGRRIKCISNIFQTHKAFMMYSTDHNKQFPANVADMGDYLGNVQIFLCPGSGRTEPPAHSVAELKDWVDYIYIAWPGGVETPGDYPQMYDRRMSNHRGEGIHVLQVAGGAFWDHGAWWLQNFAVTHPNVHVPLPEDLEPVMQKGTGTRANEATEATP